MSNDSKVNDHTGSLPYFGFGIAGLGTGLVVQAPTLLLLIYMTDSLAIPAALAGFAMFFPKLFDVITDPIMGMITDRTKSRWGRRRPYLLLGGLITGIAMIFLFSTPMYDTVNARLTYVIVLFIAMQTGVTIFMVPYYSMPAEMTNDSHEHTKLMSYRAFFSLTGVLIGGVFAPWLVIKAGGGHSGYATMSLVVGLIIGTAMVASFFGTGKVRLIERDEVMPPLATQLKIVISSRPYVIFVFSYLLFTVGFGCFAGSVPYFARYILDNPYLLSKIWLYLQIPAILAIPVWALWSKHWEKHKCFITALSILLVSASSFMLIEAGNVSMPLLYIMSSLLGFGFGGTQVTAWAILPDLIRWDTLCHNMHRGGIFAGFMTGFEKMGFAFGGLLTGGILSIMGYIESSGEVLTQPASALQGIKLATGAAGAFLFFTAIVLMSFYPLSHRILREKALLSSKAINSSVNPDYKPS